jgi:hypothetical protein
LIRSARRRKFCNKEWPQRSLPRVADGTLIDITINNFVSKETLQSDIRQVVDKGGKKVQMQIAMNSKFVGACTKDMPQL